MTPTLRLAAGSVLVALLVLGLKILAFLITDSVALLSDAPESTVNVATAVAALIAIRIAARPADDNHPYGHHKAEFLSAVLEGVLIILAALLILREAYLGFAEPVAFDAPFAGLALNLGATVLNGAWAGVLIGLGQRHGSPALVADGRHLQADVLTSFGVALGIALALLTGWWVLDPAIAALVAVHILWSGWRVMTDSLSGLMDEAVPDEMLARIRQIIVANADGAIEAHDLRTRHAGRAVFIDFHLIVPGQTSVFRAHAICDRIEKALEAEIRGAWIAIHVEPEHESEKTGAIVIE